jgi:hypothetical protein
LDFDVKRSRHQARLKTELPLVRKAERNIYRATLIEYQLARRTLMELEDIVKLEVRDSLRDLYRAGQDFEIQRTAVLLACRRVDQAQLILDLPPPPGEPRELGATAARDLLSAQQDLVDALNNLVGTWVDYQAAWLELQRDMELLDVHDPGVLNYTDPESRQTASGGHELEPLPDPQGPQLLPEPQAVIPLPQIGPLAVSAEATSELRLLPYARAEVAAPPVASLREGSRAADSPMVRQPAVIRTAGRRQGLRLDDIPDIEY